MPKATHTTTSRSNNGRPQSEIARMADEIARLQQLTLDIDRTGATDDCGDADTRTVDEPHLPDGRHQRSFFERINTQAYDRLGALEEAISFLEPETLDDVLTIAILLGTEVDRFNAKYGYDPFEDRSNNRSDDDNRKLEEAERRIERLHTAMIRGLMKFASSPIVSSGYLRETWDTIPWSEELATADAELAKMPRKRGAEPEPTNSATQH